ncbi:MAG: methyltransferase [Hyphomicrobiales bacterium]|nr:methyltransferase [Hyphomicrobiales bacterium]
MSRWAEDPVAAADALICSALDDLGALGKTLLVAPGPRVTAMAVAASSGAPEIWQRRCAIGRTDATAEPPQGPFDTVLLRLPKGRAEQEMSLHLCLSRLGEGGRLVLYGGNDEGIRAASDKLAKIAGAVDTLGTRGHGRIVAARRTGDMALRPHLADWRVAGTIDFGHGTRPWASYPGVFAGGALDDGTALLLRALPALPAGARVLDYGCGPGTIAATLAARDETLSPDMLDADAVALVAASENVPAGRTILGAGLSATRRARYDLIVSNPPIHTGVREDHRILERLITEAPPHLMPGGRLVLVVQRRIPLDRLLTTSFDSIDTLADDGRFRVWSASSPREREAMKARRLRSDRARD